MTFSNKTYDVLKWITQIFLPALGTLYVSLAEVWKFPYPEEISATIIALVLFLGLVLQISTANYRLVTFKNSLVGAPPLVKEAYVEMPGTDSNYNHQERLGSNLYSDAKDSNPMK